MKRDLTLAKIKNTDFTSLYHRFILRESLSKREYECLLAIAICFTNADDVKVKQFGYRIIVEYCNQTDNYAPLYEISIKKDCIQLVNLLSNTMFPTNIEIFLLSGITLF